MNELIEWKKLRAREGKGRRTPPWFRARLEADITIEEGLFWKTVSDTLLVLGESDDETAKKWGERLVKWEEDMRGLAE